MNVDDGARIAARMKRLGIPQGTDHPELLAAGAPPLPELLAQLRAADIAAGARSCTACGCTDNYACPEWCFWPADEHGVLDVCSACCIKLVGSDAGIEAIEQERRRQIVVEGWTLEHDAELPAGNLVDAAIAYLEHRPGPCPYCAGTGWYNDEGWQPRYAGHRRTQCDGLLRCDQLHGDPPGVWPWERAWWKPSTDPIRNLVKAGALIAAEIDRLTIAREAGQ